MTGAFSFSRLTGGLSQSQLTSGAQYDPLLLGLYQRLGIRDDGQPVDLDF